MDIHGLTKAEFAPPHLPLTGPFALVSAVICYFGIHGVRIDISTEFPFQSGLGGSGAVAIALIGAIYTALNHEAPRTGHFPSLVQIAHHLEDSLFRNTGMQDQAAALYGGVSLWEWNYANHLNFRRHELVSDLSLLNEHILVAYTGRPHLQSQNGSQMLDKFREMGALGVLVATSEQARKFADSLKRQDFGSAGEALTAEYQLRSTLLPLLRRDDQELIAMAAAVQCGASVTGHGGGGCIWAIGERENIADLRKQLNIAFERRGLGFLLSVNVADEGLKVSTERASEVRATARALEYD